MTVVVHRLEVSYGGQRLVDVADLVLDRGRPLTIVGASGSGKSLLAHAIVGTLPPELHVTGAARYGDDRVDLPDGTAHRQWGRELALLPQEPVLALDPTMRARGHVAEGHPAFRRDRPAARVAADVALADVGLDDRGGAFPHELSGGMAQRVAFAAATIGGAPVLLADEPSKGLDHAARDRLVVLLRAHVEAGGALCTITHDLDLARALGGEVAVMRAAEVVERGPVPEVLEAPRHAYTRRLVAAEPSRWRHPWAHRTPPDRAGAEELLVARGLTVGFDGDPLVRDLDVRVRAGERVAVRGPSGAGKTTLGDVLLRLRRPLAGEVHHAPSVADGGVQKLYQDPAQAFPPLVPLRDAVGDVQRRHGVADDQLHGALQRLGIDASLLARRPSQVSGGELQRIAIARASLTRPRVLFADEPTSRLDLVTQEETIAALMSATDHDDRALVLVTHDPALAAAVTDRELVLGATDGRG